MNPRNAAEIALGVAGIWLIVSRMPELGLSLVFSPGQPDGSLKWIGLAHAGAVIVCGVGLVLLRNRLAAWLVPMPPADLEGSVAGVQAVAYSVVGVFLLARGLADFLARLTLSTSEAWGSSIEQFAAPLAQIAVGAALFLGSRRLATIWRSLRTAGLSGGVKDDGVA